MTNSLNIQKKDMPASQLLNLYITSAGKKATYEDVNKAVQKEKRAEKLKDLKKKYKIFYPMAFVFYLISISPEEFADIHA